MYVEMMEEDKLMEKEIADGTIPDPNAAMDPETGLPVDPNTASSDLGAPVMEPDLESDGSATELPKGGEI